MNLLLCSAVFFPMTCAVLGYVIGRKNKNVRDYFADIVTGAEFGLFLYLFINTVMNGSSQVEVEVAGVCTGWFSGALRNHCCLYVVYEYFVL